jgi:hypothetical protein
MHEIVERSGRYLNFPSKYFRQIVEKRMLSDLQAFLSNLFVVGEDVVLNANSTNHE